MGDDDDAITPEDEINLSPPAPFRRLNDEEKEIYQADDAIDNEEDNDNDDDEEDDDHYTPPFRFHPN
jgi:hypothetical protein